MKVLAAVDEGETVREASAVAQCEADCDVEPDADAPTCDAVRLPPPAGEPVPEAETEAARVAEGDAPPVGEPLGDAVGVWQDEGEKDSELEGESETEGAKDAVTQEETEALGDAAFEKDMVGEPVADGVGREEGVPGPADSL